MKQIFFILSLIFIYSCIEDNLQKNKISKKVVSSLYTVKSGGIKLDTFVNYLFIERDKNLITLECREQPLSFGEFSHRDWAYF